MDEQSRTIELTLVADAEDADDNQWQEECRQLAKFLRTELSSHARVQPAQVSPTTVLGETSRAVDAGTFSTLLFTVFSAEALPSVAARVWDAVNDFLKRRRGSRAIIRRKGSEYVFENLTKDELLEVMKQHG